MPRGALALQGKGAGVTNVDTATHERRLGRPLDKAAAARHAKKREAIIAAAAAVINKRGVRAMTLADVSAAVGLIKNSLTYYFKRREDLAVACYLDSIARFDEIVTEAMLADTGPERLRALIGLYLDLDRRIRQGEAPAITTFSDIRTLSEPNFAVVLEAYDALFHKAQALFDDCSSLSEDARITRTNIALEQLYWTAAWLPLYEVDDYVRVEARLSDILVNGVAGPGKTWAPQQLPLHESKPDSRETLQQAATRLINQRGYRGVSLDEISAELHCTKGALYHYHSAKNDLVIACLERSCSIARRFQSNALNLSASGWDCLASALAALVNFQGSEEGPLLRHTALPDVSRNEMMHISALIANRFAGMISDGIAEGDVRPVDAAIAAHALNATINAAANVRDVTPNFSPDAVAELYARPILMGLFSS